MKYLAYFQAYTNTYAELEGLKRKYEEALSVDGWWDWSSAHVRTACLIPCCDIWKN